MNEAIWCDRRFPSTPRPNERRSEWERDLARLIHSSAFRRLQSKTQVLALGESDFYRTRLTHSMEVAQIGTGLLQELHHKYQEQSDVKGYLPDHNLMTAICLAHDIGHPPFGHGGEVALNYCMKDYGGFEGNGQTLRILSRLEKYSEHFGLNPTRRLLLGVLKYPVKYSELVNKNSYQTPSNGYHQSNTPSWLFKAKDKHPPKCYFDSEADVVDFCFEAFSAPDILNFTRFNTIEGKHSKPLYKALDTSIMDLADEISYSLHDLEDAISLGMITRKEWDEHFGQAKHAHAFEDCRDEDFNETASSIADQLFAESHERKGCIGQLVHLLISAVYLKKQDDHSFEHPLLQYKASLPANIERLRGIIFNLVLQEVILDENVQQLEFRGQKMIVELFTVLATDPERFLPKSTKEIYLKQGDNNSKMRVICDFVAGMTNDYATRMYEKIFIPGKGSIFDRL